MTTPSREQVAQWESKANKFKTGEYTETLDLVSFATLARADLEATIAELRLRLGSALGLLDADTQFEAEVNLRTLRSTIAEQAAEIESLRSTGKRSEK